MSDLREDIDFNFSNVFGVEGIVVCQRSDSYYWLLQRVSEWLLFNAKMDNLSAMSWREQDKYDDVIMY